MEVGLSDDDPRAGWQGFTVVVRALTMKVRNAFDHQRKSDRQAKGSIFPITSLEWKGGASAVSTKAKEGELGAAPGVE